MIKGKNESNQGKRLNTLFKGGRKRSHSKHECVDNAPKAGLGLDERKERHVSIASHHPQHRSCQPDIEDYHTTEGAWQLGRTCRLFLSALGVPGVEEAVDTFAYTTLSVSALTIFICMLFNRLFSIIN